jgi:AmiR/NasT family two-component response regulator
VAKHPHLVKALRTTKVLVGHPPDEDGVTLELQLKRIGCITQKAWPLPRHVPDDIDAVFFLAEADPDEQLRRLAEDRKAALVAVVGFENPLVLQFVADAHVHGTLSKPIRPLGIMACLVTALSLHRYETRLTQRIEKLDETLKTRRLVEQATRILARQKNLSEDEAYKTIRREAMNNRISLCEMADSIIKAANFL